MKMVSIETGHGPWTCLLLLGALSVVTVGKLAEARGEVCGANPAAIAAFKSTQNFTAQRIRGVGYDFCFSNPALTPVIFVPGPNITRGLVILPEEGVAPISYAPYARSVALLGYCVTIVEKATPEKVIRAMMEHSELEFWSLAGHGKGGEIAARIAVTLEPRVRSLVLIAAALPQDVDLRSTNLFLSVVYGANDTISTPTDVENSFSRALGDALVTRLPGIGHYDFAYSSCLGNIQAPSRNNSTLVTNPTVPAAIIGTLRTSILFAVWYVATEKALSYGDNHYLTPGFNDSKPYPGDIRVRFDQLPIPGTSPQRFWWVFTPSEIKGGIVYYSGGTVDGRAYFPLAFEIAARGHLVVIPQIPSRNALSVLSDANSVIDSNLSIFSGVPRGRWAIAGHSLGGWGAAAYVACFGDKIYGAVTHAGLWNFDTNTVTSQVPVLQIYGSLDNVNDGGGDAWKYNYLDFVNLNKTTFLSIRGANHHQVGDYGYQVRDQIATISLETQHAIFANETVSFLDALETKLYAPIRFNSSVCTTYSPLS